MQSMQPDANAIILIEQEKGRRVEKLDLQMEAHVIGKMRECRLQNEDDSCELTRKEVEKMANLYVG